MNSYRVGDLVKLKKKHPCGSFLFEVIRTGSDIKIKCTNCGHVILIDRLDLNKKIIEVSQKKEDL